MTHYTVFRGEYGAQPDLSTRHGTLTFCDDYSVCEHYALHPSSPQDKPVYPRVIEADITLRHPFINQPRDAYLDVTTLVLALGVTPARRIALKFAAEIEKTDQWLYRIQPSLPTGMTLAGYIKRSNANLHKLYFQAYPYFDDIEETRLLLKQGYDGAIMVGNAVSMNTIEYRVFDKSTVVVRAVTPLTQRATPL